MTIRTPGTRTESTWSGVTTYGEIETFETEHKGQKIVIRTQARTQVFPATDAHEERTYRGEESEVTVNGRAFGVKPAGTFAQAAKKIANKLDEKAENADLLPRVQAVISNTVPPFIGFTQVRVGDVVSIHSMGQWRQGIVVKVAKTRATVAFTSASNPKRIFRKADTITSLRRF